MSARGRSSAPVPAHVSHAQREFLARATPLDVAGLLGPGGVHDGSSWAAVRARVGHGSGTPPAALVGVALAETRIAGVRVLELTPPPPSWSRAPRGGIVHLHGGGFTHLRADDCLLLPADLARRTGRVVRTIDYRLAPEHPFPAALDDVDAVLRELAGRTGARDLALVGESAGGNLALAATSRLRARGLGRPAGLALFSPWTDLASSDQAAPAGPDPVLDERNVAPCAAAYAAGRALDDPELSPLHATHDRDFPPVLVVSGTRDLFLSSCERLRERLRSAGAPVELAVLDAMYHGFHALVESPESRRARRLAADFLSRVLR